MRKQDLLVSSGAALLPWLAVASVLIVASAVNRAIDLGSLELAAPTLVPNPTMVPTGDVELLSRHLVARVSWGVAAIGFPLVAIAAVATSAFVLLAVLLDLPRRQRTIVGIALAAAFVGLFAVVSFGPRDILSEPALTEELRRLTLHHGGLTPAVAIDSTFDRVSALLFLLLVSSSSAVLVRPKQGSVDAPLVSRRLAQLRWVLYAGAAALVLRTIEMYTLYRWPGAWIPQLAGSVDRVALAVSTAHGAFFAAILASAYLPAALVLRGRAGWLVERALPAGSAGEREAWLSKAGLGSSPFQDLARLAATLSPLLAGTSIAKILQALGG